MKWIAERDALIAQTLAFVQSVTGRKDDLLQPEGTPVAPSAAAEVRDVATVAVETEGVKASVPPPPAPPQRPVSDFRTEMQARIANFRKHQERFEREREEYCAETLTKLRAALREGPGPQARK
jgi:hypothetical protein